MHSVQHFQEYKYHWNRSFMTGYLFKYEIQFYFIKSKLSVDWVTVLEPLEWMKFKDLCDLLGGCPCLPYNPHWNANNAI